MRPTEVNAGRKIIASCTAGQFAAPFLFSPVQSLYMQNADILQAYR
jgi:hypothetical protein